MHEERFEIRACDLTRISVGHEPASRPLNSAERRHSPAPAALVGILAMVADDGQEFFFSDALSFGKISTLSPTATSNRSARQARACQETDGAVLMKRMLIEDRRVWGLTDHVAARHVAHSAYVETLRATYLHVGDTPDGEWGLYCPRTRRSGTGRWITLFTVRYDITDKPFESAKEELAHDGQGFASCSFVRWMSVQHPATLDAWHRTVFDLYEKL